METKEELLQNKGDYIARWLKKAEGMDFLSRSLDVLDFLGHAKYKSGRTWKEYVLLDLAITGYRGQGLWMSSENDFIAQWWVRVYIPKRPYSGRFSEICVAYLRNYGNNISALDNQFFIPGDWQDEWEREVKYTVEKREEERQIQYERSISWMNEVIETYMAINKDEKTAS